MTKVSLNFAAFAKLVLLAIVSLYLAWQVNAQVNYGYRWLYHSFNIEQHISEYGPQNRFRLGFGQTTPEQHQSLFNQIVDSVHNHGQGLTEIVYYAQGLPPQPLLTRLEIIHLQDVANLIDKLNNAIVFVLLLLAMALAYLRLQARKGNCASVKGVVLSFAVTCISLTAAVFIIGPRVVFYQAHALIFPPENPWFFYYQDSLMSTLMKAPYLFGGIAIQIVVVALLIGVILNKIINMTLLKLSKS